MPDRPVNYQSWDTRLLVYWYPLSFILGCLDAYSGNNPASLVWRTNSIVRVSDNLCCTSVSIPFSVTSVLRVYFLVCDFPLRAWLQGKIFWWSLLLVTGDIGTPFELCSIFFFFPHGDWTVLWLLEYPVIMNHSLLGFLLRIYFIAQIYVEGGQDFAVMNHSLLCSIER